jgi:hypothetical protein
MRYIIPVTLAVVLFVYGLIDCIRSEPRDVRSISKSAWVAVIVVLNVIGVALWFMLGRPRYAPASFGSQQGSTSLATSRRGPSSGPAGRSTAPDDDPDFLRNLALNRAQKLEAERLRKLKSELDAREAKLRDQHPNDENTK